jgi:hypothetical protein
MVGHGPSRERPYPVPPHRTKGPLEAGKTAITFQKLAQKNILDNIYGFDFSLALVNCKIKAAAPLKF